MGTILFIMVISPVVMGVVCFVACVVDGLREDARCKRYDEWVRGERDDFYC